MDHTVSPVTRHKWIYPAEPWTYMLVPNAGEMKGWGDLVHTEIVQLPIQVVTMPSVVQPRWSRPKWLLHTTTQWACLIMSSCIMPGNYFSSSRETTWTIRIQSHTRNNNLVENTQNPWNQMLDCIYHLIAALTMYFQSSVKLEMRTLYFTYFRLYNGTYSCLEILSISPTFLKLLLCHIDSLLVLPLW